MNRWLKLTEEPIDESALNSGRDLSGGAGAVICFLGVVRGTEEGNQISGIEYEAFEAMVTRQFGLLFDQMEERWPVESVRLVHRTGWVASQIETASTTLSRLRTFRTPLRNSIELIWAR